MLFSMSSAAQPREWAMNGCCGNWAPSSAKNVSICPTTPCTLSCPPVTMNAATLLRISTRPAMVSWFWMQLQRSTIL